jgi:hypothetical protein
MLAIAHHGVAGDPQRNPLQALTGFHGSTNIE